VYKMMKLYVKVSDFLFGISKS